MATFCDFDLNTWPFELRNTITITSLPINLGFPKINERVAVHATQFHQFREYVYVIFSYLSKGYGGLDHKYFLSTHNFA
jgi:hypothetical protein